MTVPRDAVTLLFISQQNTVQLGLLLGLLWKNLWDIVVFTYYNGGPLPIAVLRPHYNLKQAFIITAVEVALELLHTLHIQF